MKILAEIHLMTGGNFSKNVCVKSEESMRNTALHLHFICSLVHTGNFSKNTF